jgi:uncharacterized protein YjbI with pentapeptide repeats
MRWRLIMGYMIFLNLFLGLVLTPLQTVGAPTNTAKVLNLADILREHSLWLASQGNAGTRADLRGASLETLPAGTNRLGPRSVDLILSGGVVLRNVDLRQADIRSARLRAIDLDHANLQGARFNETDLRWAILSDANLQGADFSQANLAGADFRRANLNQAKFAGADLTSADLTEAKCLTAQQLVGAKTDANTKLPKFEDCVGGQR